VLKQAAVRILPAEVLTRRKQGFGVPIGDWFRGPLRGLMSDALQSPRSRQRGYFAPKFVDRLIAEHLSERRDHTSRLWTLLMFELWHRQYLDRPISGATSGSAVVPFDRNVFPQKDKAPGGRARPTPLAMR
jgi:asparagine synthase (glutamine-hydrolysing)